MAREAGGPQQQYLEKNADGYCGLGGTGVSCPVGAGVPAAASP
jgi:peptide-methionine (S)-S-oxide reductase